MKNYIKINNQKIELTDAQIKEIQRSFGISSIKLCDIAEGETFDNGWVHDMKKFYDDETFCAYVDKMQMSIDGLEMIYAVHA